MRTFLYLLLVVAILPLVLLIAAAHIGWYYKEFAEREVTNLEVARAVAMAFTAFIRDISGDEQAVGHALAGLSAPTPEQAGKYLAANAANYKRFARFYWTSAQGETIASSDGRGLGVKVDDAPWFKQILGGADRVITDLRQDPAGGPMTFTIASGIRAEGGALEGALFAVIDPSLLGDRVLDIDLAPGGVFSVFDRTGTVVYTYPERALSFDERRWLDKDPMIATALAGREVTGTFIFPPTGETRIGARVPLPRIGWAVGASRPLTDVTSPLLRTLVIDLGIMVAVIGASGLIAGLISRRITGPARRLRDGAIAIGAGDLDRRVHVRGVAELAELGEAFNRMAVGLKDARKAIQEANAQLEQRVQERTADLVAANKALQRGIAERKRMEEELRRTSLYARGLIEASLDPLVTISPDGKITDVNRATEEATGLSRERLVGTDFSDYFTEPDKARAVYRQVIAEGEVRDYALTIRHTSGRAIDVLYNATVYRNEAGEVQGVFAAARDVTEHKKAEAELEKYRQHLEDLVKQRTAQLEASNRQLQAEIAEHQRVAEDLARSNRDLEQFAYVASHDLQEPLRIVVGYLQLLERRYKGRLDHEADEFIHFAVDGAARMQTLIHDLLAYSRVGTQSRRFTPVPCESVLARALANLRQSIADTGATVTHDPLPTVLGDVAQLAQVFQNLIGNAIKFRGNQPPRVHVSARPKDDEWLFAVQDNSIGFEPEYADRIFAIFQRLHTREKYPGTGIGLSICKRIVERHGGRIWAESQPGKGSTFYFTLAQSRSVKDESGMGGRQSG